MLQQYFGHINILDIHHILWVYKFDHVYADGNGGSGWWWIVAGGCGCDSGYDTDDGSSGGGGHWCILLS